MNKPIPLNKLFLPMLFILALIPRLIFLIQFRETPYFDHLFWDSEYFHKMALAISGGNFWGDSVFFMSPVYPYFLSIFYAIFGPDLLIPRIIQILLGASIPLLTYKIAERIFGTGTAVIASLLIAFSGILIFYESNYLPDHPILTFLLLGNMLLLLHAREKQLPLFWLYCGLAFGMLILGRGSLLILLPFIIFWMIREIYQNKWRLILSYILGLTLIAGAVTIRNAIVGKDFVPLTSNGGLNIYIGNHENATGGYDLIPGYNQVDDPAAANMAGKELKKPNLKPSEVSGFWMNKSMQFIMNHPFRYLFLLIRKTMFYFSWYEYPQPASNYHFVRTQFDTLLKYPFVAFALICSPGLAGLVISWRKHGHATLIHLIFIGYAISVILFFITARCRIPVQPVYAISAAHTMCLIAESIRKWDWKAIVLSILILSFFVGFEKKLNFIFDVHHANDYLILGQIYQQDAQYEKAVIAYRKAEAEAQQSNQGYFDIAREKWEEKKYWQAFQNYRRAVQPHVYWDKIYHCQARSLVELEEHELAVANFRKALIHNPENPAAFNELGMLYSGMKAYNLAETTLKAGIRQDPNWDQLHNNLGIVYLSQKKYKKAKEAFQNTLELNPGHANAKQNLHTLSGMGY